jgi:hypothetical protein
MSSKSKRQSGRSWRKLLRAREGMRPRGFDLEIDEFVRVQLGKAGKQRSTNVWMDYVKDEERRRRREEAAENERQRQLYEQRRQREQTQTAAADWATTMAGTRMFEDALGQHLDLSTPPVIDTASMTAASMTPSYRMASSLSPPAAEPKPRPQPRQLVRSQSERSTHRTTKLDSSTSVWPPLNLNSPWADYAQQSNAGKGSSRLNQSSSYSFQSWATDAEKVLPPLSPEARRRMATRTATSSRLRRTLAMARKEGDADDVRAGTAPHPNLSSPKVLDRIQHHEMGTSTDPMACQICLDGKYTGAPDHVCMRCGHVHKERKAASDRETALQLDAQHAEDARLAALLPDPDGYDDKCDTEWTKFMQEHEQKVKNAREERARLEQERQRQQEETGFAPPPISASVGFEGSVIDPEKLPPSAMLRGRRVLDRDAVPLEPSRRRQLRLEEDLLHTCTDPSKILPIPTMNARHFGELLRSFGTDQELRGELVAMENEERATRTFMKEEARARRLAEGQNNDAKAKKALMTFLKRGMIRCFEAWKEYCEKMNSCRRFMRKILLGKQHWVFDTFKDYAWRRSELKRRGITALQRFTRGFVARKTFYRLRRGARAHHSIKKSWRAYCARTLLDRMIRKREEEEALVRMNIRRMLLRSSHKALLAWHQHTRVMRYAALMGAKSGKTLLRYRFQTWSSNVNMIIFRKPMAAESIQRMARAYFVRVSLARNIKRIKAAMPIQRMVRAWIARTTLARVNAKREALMMRVRKRMLAEMHTIMRLALGLLSNHAKTQIEHRAKLGGFVALKTRKMLAAWRVIAVTQIAERSAAVLVIQAGYRGLLGRRIAEMRRIARDQATSDKAQREAMKGLDATLMDQGPKIDPKTGLPILTRSTPRLDLLKSERTEVHALAKKAAKAAKKAAGKYAGKDSKKAAAAEEFKHFDSQVLSFSQRFRLRTETSFLIGFLETEIKKETWRIWKKDREEEIEVARKMKETIEADAKRAAEMEAMLDAANKKRAEIGGAQLEKFDVAYPTAGILLDFKTATLAEMEYALDSWMALMDGGFLPRQTLVSWIARGIMNQDTPQQRVHSWDAIKSKLDRTLMIEVNLQVGEEKREARKALAKSGGKHQKSLRQEVLDQPGEVARRRRWKFRL